MTPLAAESWSNAGDAHKTLCITQANWSIRWHLQNFYGVSVPEYERRGHFSVEGAPFDVYEAAIPGGRREYWMDVSYWFNRGLLMQPDRFNGPPPDELTTVAEFLGEFELRNLPFGKSFLERIQETCSGIGLRFMRYSSQQLGHNVAHIFVEDGNVIVEATAVRRFLTDSLPLLHGFRFVKPFLMHQVLHLLIRENPLTTELSPKGDYFLPTPGVDCVDFVPADQESPANDFWNYMLRAHRPGAFQSEAERVIVSGSAMTAISSGFLNARELVDALQRLDVKGADGEVLGELAKRWLTPNGH